MCVSSAEEQPGRLFGELAAWQGLLRTHARVIRALDERLVRSHGLSVSEFDVLITLANAPDQQLRMTELAGAVMLSPSGLTRLIALFLDRVPQRDRRALARTWAVAEG